MDLDGQRASPRCELLRIWRREHDLGTGELRRRTNADALLALRYGEGGWTSFDRSCLSGAGAGLLLWWVFNSPVVALVTTLCVDLTGALPTIRKAYHAPDTEDRLAWALFISGNTVNLVAIEAWRFANVVYPVYMFLASGVIAGLVLWPRTVSGTGGR